MCSFKALRCFSCSSILALSAASLVSQPSASRPAWMEAILLLLMLSNVVILVGLLTTNKLILSIMCRLATFPSGLQVSVLAPIAVGLGSPGIASCHCGRDRRETPDTLFISGHNGASETEHVGWLNSCRRLPAGYKVRGRHVTPQMRRMGPDLSPKPSATLMSMAVGHLFHLGDSNFQVWGKCGRIKQGLYVAVLTPTHRLQTRQGLG